MITYSFENRVRCHYKNWKFPAGEVGVRVLNHGSVSSVKHIRINASITSSDEVMELFMLTDALRRKFYNAEISLALGYVPYGRQDRVCEEGDSLSIAVFANLINSQNYAHVYICDPHSDVTPALFKNVVVDSQADIFEDKFDYIFDWENDNRVLVAPDAGAAKKAAVIATGGKFSDVLYAVKSRDMATGEITKLTLTGDVSGKDVVVVDDIGDGMGTFVQLGKLIKEQNPKSMTLIITHGIFSKGHKVVTDIYDKVYTTNTYHQDRVGLIDGVEYVQLI